jgi:hypothetical protein
MEFLPQSGTYLIVAGAFNDSHDFRLYKWSGKVSDAAVEVRVEVGDCKPEELIVRDVRGRSHEIELLSDDGDRDVEGQKCKKARRPKRSFRGLRTTINL